MIFYNERNDPRQTRRRMRGPGPGSMSNLQSARELLADTAYDPMGIRNIPYNRYQPVESGYMTDSIGYFPNKVAIESSDIPGDLKQGDVLDVTLQQKTGEVKVEKAENNRAEIEQAIADIAGIDTARGDMQFAEHNPEQDNSEIQDNSSEIQQEAYGITYEMISGRASASDIGLALQELDTDGIIDQGNPDLEGILDTDQVDSELTDAVHELGLDNVDGTVAGEDEAEYVELVEYWG